MAHKAIEARLSREAEPTPPEDSLTKASNKPRLSVKVWISTVRLSTHPGHVSDTCERDNASSNKQHRSMPASRPSECA
eukprot:1288302-Amphidinium_carterae.1